MSVLPSDFALPAAPYLLGLLVAAAIVVGALYRRRPTVTEALVTAVAPWMAAGGALYAVNQCVRLGECGSIGAGWLLPLFGSPAVYGTVGVACGATLAVVGDRDPGSWRVDSTPGLLALVGGGLLVAAVLGAVALATGGVDLVVSSGILAASIGLTGVVWFVLDRGSSAPAATGTAGLLVVFGHVLDGVSTAVGYDLLGFGEQTPLARVLIQLGASLPTADLVGAAWLFVLVKVLVAAGVVVLFETSVREAPREGYLLLGLVAAVGLGPGAHNVVLFAVAG